jgi:small GTP-binding protein
MKYPKSPPRRGTMPERSYPQNSFPLLIVDDNRDLVNFLRRLIEGTEFEPETAESGHEARELGVKQRFDFALIDYMLPDANGIELGIELQQRTPEIIVVIMTGAIMPPDEQAICNERGFQILRKPFLAGDLMNGFRDHVRVLDKASVTKYQLDRAPLNEGKLIFVGRGEVGKTSLVRRLVEKRFNEGEAKTQGIRITNWRLRSGGATVRLNIWDFGGQEIMHSTHQFFLTRQSLYILVLNGREGGEDVDAEYWLKHIETFGAESPVIVVQNKIAQHPFDLNYRGLRARYPQIKDFVKTDCREGIGLDALRSLIKLTVAGMPEIRMPFPPDCLRIKKRLELMLMNILATNSSSSCAKRKASRTRQIVTP